MVRPVIHSEKHYVQQTLTSATTLARVNVSIASALASPSSANEVAPGVNIKAVYLEIWAIAETANQFFTAILYKRPSGLASVTFAEMTNLFTYENKKNILYTTQGLAPNDGVGQPIVLAKGWFKIPKGKQRFGLGDKLTFSIASRGDGTINFCGFALYKEYS